MVGYNLDRRCRNRSKMMMKHTKKHKMMMLLMKRQEAVEVEAGVR